MNRVQKGNKSFKPVAKNRARPAVTRNPELEAASAVLPTERASSVQSNVIDHATGSTSFPTLRRDNTPVPSPLPPVLISSLNESTPIPITIDTEPEPPHIIPQLISRDSPPRNAPPVIMSSEPTEPPRSASLPPPEELLSQPSRPPDHPPPEPVTQDKGTTEPSIVAPDSPDSIAETSKTSHSDSSKKSKKRKRAQDSSSQTEGAKQSKSLKAKSKRPRPRASVPPSQSKVPITPSNDPLFLLSESEPEDVSSEEVIDPLMRTMATLCDDSSHGQPSTKSEEIQANFVAWKTRNKEKRAQMRVAVEQRKRGLPEENIDSSATKSLQEDPLAKENTPPPIPTEQEPVDGDDGQVDFDYTQNLNANRYNIQVRIGPKGETIIDEESMVVDRGEPEDTENYTHVIESDATKFTNSATYGRKLRGSRWSAEETELFYDALSQYGQNFELIACILPGRDRKACKNKFKAEDKRSPARITHSLKNSIPVDMATLTRMTGKDFSGPVPEIKIPERPDLPPLASHPTDSETESTQQTSKRSRKRKGSSTSGLNNDVQIIGSADTFEQSNEGS